MKSSLAQLNVISGNFEVILLQLNTAAENQHPDFSDGIFQASDNHLKVLFTIQVKQILIKVIKPGYWKMPEFSQSTTT